MKKDIAIFTQTIVSCGALLIFRILFHFNVYGSKSLNEFENKPVIFASNHNSYIDGGIAGASIIKAGLNYKKFFPIRFLVSSEYFKWKYFPANILVMLTGSVKIERALEKKPDNSHLFNVLSESIKTLKKAGKIWIYPHGGFNNDGSPKKARYGAIFLHQQTKTPIIPVKIIGNDKVMSNFVPFLPTFKTLMMSNRINVIFGEPIYNFKTQDIDKNTKILMDKIEKITQI